MASQSRRYELSSPLTGPDVRTNSRISRHLVNLFTMRLGSEVSVTIGLNRLSFVITCKDAKTDIDSVVEQCLRALFGRSESGSFPGLRASGGVLTIVSDSGYRTQLRFEPSTKAAQSPKVVQSQQGEPSPEVTGEWASSYSLIFSVKLCVNKQTRWFAERLQAALTARGLLVKKLTVTGASIVIQLHSPSERQTVYEHVAQALREMVIADDRVFPDSSSGETITVRESAVAGQVLFALKL